MNRMTRRHRLLGRDRGAAGQAGPLPSPTTARRQAGRHDDPFDQALAAAVRARDEAHQDEADERSRQVRLRLASLGSRISLPLARRALGLLEGEHHSDRAGNGFDYLDLRDYQAGDEARLIDWKASARLGRPIVVNKRRDVTSTVWLLLDCGSQMLASAEDGERQIDVAANVLRMVALLSLRRGDDISLVLANGAQVVRTPFSGGYARFDRLLREKISAAPDAPSDVEAMLSYARRVEGRDTLIVLATGEHALTARAGATISALSQEHPLFFSVTKAVNPFAAGTPARDAATGRLMPAFLRTPQARRDFEDRRTAAADALRRDLDRHGDTLLWSGSSQGMLDGFIRLVRLSRFGVRPGSTSLLTRAVAGEAGERIL